MQDARVQHALEDVEYSTNICGTLTVEAVLHAAGHPRAAAPLARQAQRGAPHRHGPRGSGLTAHACHVILRIVDPRFLSQMESLDAVSIICQALLVGKRVRVDGKALRYFLFHLNLIRFVPESNHT